MQRVPCLQDTSNTMVRRQIRSEKGRIKLSDFSAKTKSNKVNNQVSRNSGLLTQKYNKDVAAFTQNMRSLQSSSKKVLNIDFNRTKDVTASSDIVTGKAESAAQSATYDILVTQIAKAQQNDSSSFLAGGTGILTPGDYSIGITTGTGAEKTVSFHVSGADNNWDIMNKLANAMNASGAGVTAELKTKGNMQMLRLTAKDTGSVNGFSLRDITGNAAASLRLSSNVTTKGEDARYKIQGTEYTSASNRITLDNGNVALTLQNPSSAPVKVTVGDSKKSMLAAVKEMIQNYNQLQNTLSGSTGVTVQGNNLLFGVSNKLSKTRMKEFADIGITLNQSTGQISLDEQKFTAASGDTLKQLLTSGIGLADELSNVSKRALDTPVSWYISSPSSLDAWNYSSPYNNYSAWGNLGNIFNYKG